MYIWVIIYHFLFAVFGFPLRRHLISWSYSVIDKLQIVKSNKLFLILINIFISFTPLIYFIYSSNIKSYWGNILWIIYLFSHFCFPPVSYTIIIVYCLARINVIFLQIIPRNFVFCCLLVSLHKFACCITLTYRKIANLTISSY